MCENKSLIYRVFYCNIEGTSGGFSGLMPATGAFVFHDIVGCAERRYPHEV
jgi:hypothetical protein